MFREENEREKTRASHEASFLFSFLPTQIENFSFSSNTYYVQARQLVDAIVIKFTIEILERAQFSI